MVVSVLGQGISLTHAVAYDIIAVGTKGRGADVPLFETIKTNAGTQPKNELQL